MALQVIELSLRWHIGLFSRIQREDEARREIEAFRRQQQYAREYKANMIEDRLKTKAELMKDMAMISINNQHEAKSVYAPFEVKPLSEIYMCISDLIHKGTQEEPQWSLGFTLLVCRSKVSETINCGYFMLFRDIAHCRGTARQVRNKSDRCILDDDFVWNKLYLP